jgi:hypothetical protein
VEPTFSVPVNVDNPLFPISELHSAVLLGNEERHPLRIETVLLPEPKVIGANLEALALAVPTDARTGGVPAELETISRGAAEIFAAAGAGDWEAATSTLGAMDAAWAAHQATGTVPPLLDAQMSDALDALAGDALVPAVADRNPEGARNAALDVEMAALDLQLQYRPPAEIDLGRFGIWADQLVVDAASTPSAACGPRPDRDAGHGGANWTTITPDVGPAAPADSTTATRRWFPPFGAELASVTGMSTDPPAPMMTACSFTATTLLAS